MITANDPNSDFLVTEDELKIVQAYCDEFETIFDARDGARADELCARLKRENGQIITSFWAEQTKGGIEDFARGSFVHSHFVDALMSFFFSTNKLAKSKEVLEKAGKSQPAFTTLIENLGNDAGK